VALKIGVKSRKIKVIYNSVDFIDLNISTKKINRQDKIILTVARLTYWKGIDMLIEIMPDLIKKHENTKLIIVGKGPERDKLKKLRNKLNLKKHITFTGKLDRQEVVRCMQVASIFALNTNYEGMSHTILEAMKTGLPVVTTKAGGNIETVKDGKTGILIDYRKKEQWIKVINFLLDNPKARERLAKNAKEDLKRFSWKKLVKQTVEVFDNV